MIKMLVCDFDGTISGGGIEDVARFTDAICQQDNLMFVIATGRTYQSLQKGLSEAPYPPPHSVISDVGTQIHHELDVTLDQGWVDKLRPWSREAVAHALAPLSFLGKQQSEFQGEFKLTYEGKISQSQLAQVCSVLDANQLSADITYSHDWFLDLTPKGANKASALSYLMDCYGIEPHEVVVAGDSANDTVMLTMAGVNAVLVANHYPEVAHLGKLENVYVAKASHAQGVLEGVKYWQAHQV